MVPLCKCVAQAPGGYPEHEKLASGDAVLEDALRAEDFVVAIVTHSSREHMLTSSRISRQVKPHSVGCLQKLNGASLLSTEG